MKNPFLIGNKIYLRAFEEGDEEMIALSENHPDPRETLFYAFPTSPEQNLKKWREKRDDHNSIGFVIVLKEKDRPVGVTSLERIDWVGRMATFYIAIAEKQYWSGGFGSEATSMMIDYTFATLNLNRLQLHVSVENERAVKVYERLGFKVEGTLKQAMFHNNRYIDFHLMAILRDEWKKHE